MHLVLASLIIGLYLALWKWGWFAGGECKSRRKLESKIVVITGANTGIGYETALDLAQRGAKIIMGCRDIAKAKDKASLIEKATGKRPIVLTLDLAKLSSVKSFVQEIKSITNKIDLLVNNAGGKRTQIF